MYSRTNTHHTSCTNFFNSNLLSFLFITILLLTSVISTSISWQTREFQLNDLAWSTKQYGLGADPSRFLLQAHWLSEGLGYREATANGTLCTSLPPGHPVILSLLFQLTENLDYLRYIYSLLPFSSGVLIFFSLRNIFLRYFASFLISSSPWLTALSSCHMSETTSSFLVALLVFHASILLGCSLAPTAPLSKIHFSTFRQSVLHKYLFLFSFFSFGFFAAVTILTAPALLFSIFSLVAIFCFHFKSYRGILLCVTLGLLIPLSCWQIHCIYAVGHPVLTLLTPVSNLNSPEVKWVSTWARSPSETSLGYSNFVWNVDNDFSDVPEHAFLSDSEKTEIISAYRQGLKPNQTADAIKDSTRARRDVLLKSIECRKSQQFVAVFILLPLRRGILSWIEAQPVSYHGHDSPSLILRLLPWNFMSEISDYGIYRACLRASRGLFALFVLVVHYATITVIVYSILKSLKLMPLGTVIILGSILLFTYLNCLIGPECRRNLPFLPLLFSLPAIAIPLSRKHRNTSTSSRAISQ
jgi:hypothetical protein